MTALLIGCGGGGGGGNSSDGTANSTPANTASSSSSQASTSAEQISSANLANMTVVAEYRDGTIVQNIRKVSYIFLPNNQAIVVFDSYNFV